MEKNNDDDKKNMKYAIDYIDNGGKLENFTHRHNKIRKSIETVEKKRMMVHIRYDMINSIDFSKEIQIKLNKTENILEEPAELYKVLDKLSYDELKNLKNMSLNNISNA